MILWRWEQIDPQSGGRSREKNRSTVMELSIADCNTRSMHQTPKRRRAFLPWWVGRLGQEKMNERDELTIASNKRKKWMIDDNNVSNIIYAPG